MPELVITMPVTTPPLTVVTAVAPEPLPPLMATTGTPTYPLPLEKLSELLAQRKMETEGVLKEVPTAGEQVLKQRQYTATFLNRLRTFFEL